MMNRKTVLTLLVISLVVLSGCSSLFGDNPQPTATDTVQQTETPTPGTPDNDTELPQNQSVITGLGVSQTELLNRHDQALSQYDSFVFVVNSTRHADNLVTQSTSQVYRYDIADNVYNISVTTNSYQYDFYQDGSTYYTRSKFGNQSYTYNVASVSAVNNSQNRTSPQLLFLETQSFSDLEFEEVNTTQMGGQQVTIYEATTSEVGSEFGETNETVSNATFRIAIRDDGLITRASYNLTYRNHSNGITHQKQVLKFKQFNSVSISEPGWVEEAREQQDDNEQTATATGQEQQTTSGN